MLVLATKGIDDQSTTIFLPMLVRHYPISSTLKCEDNRSRPLVWTVWTQGSRNDPVGSLKSHRGILLWVVVAFVEWHAAGSSFYNVKRLL